MRYGRGLSGEGRLFWQDFHAESSGEELCRTRSPGLSFFEGLVEAGEGGLVYRQNQENAHNQQQRPQQEQRNREELKAKHLPEFASVPDHCPALPHGIRGLDPRIISHDEKRHRQANTSDDARNDKQKNSEENRQPDQNHGDQRLNKAVSGLEAVKDDLEWRVRSRSPQIQEVAVLPDCQGADDDNADVHASGDALQNSDNESGGECVKPRPAQGSKSLTVQF